jgi:hypothetical protein
LASPSYPSPKERDDTSMFLQTSQIRPTSFFSAFLASPSYPSPEERDDTSMFLQTSQIRPTSFFSAFLALPSYPSPKEREDQINSIFLGILGLTLLSLSLLLPLSSGIAMRGRGTILLCSAKRYRFHINLTILH